MFAYIVRG